jgi:hypothetical protein
MLTEAEWRVSNDPQAMLEILRGNPCASERKSRLFACACAECGISQLSNRIDYSRVLATAEKAAEGLAQAEEVSRVNEEVVALQIDSATRIDARIAAMISGALRSDAYGGACGVVFDALHDELENIRLGKPETFAHFLRCIFGIPYRGLNVGFRLVKLDPAWRTSDVLALAKGIYDDRAFDRMPILADALQDAGCDNDDILNHCRDASTPHARGCWVVDLVLEKA